MRTMNAARVPMMMPMEVSLRSGSLRADSASRILLSVAESVALSRIIRETVSHKLCHHFMFKIKKRKEERLTPYELKLSKALQSAISA